MTTKSSPATARRLSTVSNWDYETDVAIVGMGGAGSSAAIEAADAGVRVMGFEQSSDTGGSTKLSSCEIYMGGGGGTRVQRACGYEDSTENMKAFIMACFEEYADEAKVDAYCEGSVGHFQWLTETLGIPFADTEYKERAILAYEDHGVLYTGNEKAWPMREKAEPVPRGHNLHIMGDNGGPLFFEHMDKALAERDIDLRKETRVLSLIADDVTGEVMGVVIRENQQEKTVRAHKGVILTAGGFVMNEEMLAKYCPDYPFEKHMPIGNPGDTGSGIMMGQSVGGAAINMDQCFTSIPFYPPASATNGIFITDKGQRFINEDSYHGRVGYYAWQQPSQRIYLILDVEAYGDYEKGNFLMAEVCGTGDTIEELEEELALPKDSLTHTMNQYNANAANGEDPLFHKSKEWLRPLQAPFVALDCTREHLQMVPLFTLGGLDTLPTGEVLNNERQPVAGLYAAGRTTAGIPRTSQGYASGMSVGDATFFGRLAGKQAAAR